MHSSHCGTFYLPHRSFHPKQKRGDMINWVVITWGAQVSLEWALFIHSVPQTWVLPLHPFHSLPNTCAYIRPWAIVSSGI